VSETKSAHDVSELLSRVGWLLDTVRGTTIANAELPVSVSDLERLAALLTADDERQREAIEKRAWMACGGDFNPTNGLPPAWNALWRGICGRAPLSELRALEAAYRAAVDQG